MSSASENNKRIAKNTVMLYFRMILLLLVSLYTSRVILNALGVEDYGIYNVVGGVVTMFSLVSGSLTSAITRFITFELGRKDIDKLKRVFCTSVSIQIGISVIFALLAETIGLWFLNTHMYIPEERMYAANWVLHFSVITFIVNLISVPYNAAIIAHEHMSAFAYIGMLEAVCKLIVAFLIMVSPTDRLIFYAILNTAVAVLIRAIYGAHCKRHFEECTYHFVFEKSLVKEMTVFAGWNFMSNIAYLFNTQGVNILMNLFFGVTVNAARGVAVQVNSAVRQFISNLTTAVNPQITKSYAAGDFVYMHELMCRGAKFSAFLLFIFAIPIILETEIILHIWLKNPPEYATVFVQLTFFGTFVDNVLCNSMITAMLATGKIKRYQIIDSAFEASVFFITWAGFAMGFGPESAYIVFGVVYSILVFVRLSLLRELVRFSAKQYLHDVIFKVIPVLVLSFAVPFMVQRFFAPGLLRLGVVIITSIPLTLIFSYILGLTPNERTFIRERVSKKICKTKR